jgi:hypothetical protein
VTTAAQAAIDLALMPPDPEPTPEEEEFVEKSAVQKPPSRTVAVAVGVVALGALV